MLLFSFTNSFSSGLECDGTVSYVVVVVGFFSLSKNGTEYLLLSKLGDCKFLATHFVKWELG